MIKKVLQDIFFVGYVDWILRDFHSFETRRGVTYNSYLIKDEKIALIDTVKSQFCKELLKNISEIVSPEKINYIIVNHAEPDHAGALSELMKVCKNAKIISTAKGKEILSAYHNTSAWNFQIVKSGDNLSLGKRTIEFIETPMLHWPDSMFSYLKEERALFSMDAFGQQFSSTNKFDDEVDFCEVIEEAKRYYANVIMPFGRQVLSALEKLSKYDLKLILPSHGIIWRKHIPDIIEAYRKWASSIPCAKVLVIYDTMWQSTKLMAESIYRGASAKNIEVKLLSAKTSGLTEIATEVLDAASIAFGSSNLNMSMMPLMGSILTYLKGLSPRNKVGALFGSYGWGRGAVEDMADWMKQTDFKLLSIIKAKWSPSENILNECFDLGGILADKALEMVNTNHD
jgi:flavorubredoxin